MREMRTADSGVEKIDLTTDVATAPIQTVIGGSFREEDSEDQASREEKIVSLSEAAYTV